MSSPVAPSVRPESSFKTGSQLPVVRLAPSLAYKSIGIYILLATPLDGIPCEEKFFGVFIFNILQRSRGRVGELLDC